MSAPPLPAAVILGTRASALARAQTELVAGLLVDARPDIVVSTRVLSTVGDRTQATGEPLPEIGGKGLFTAELERALLDGEIDLAVHSLKDLPTEDVDGVVLGAVPVREDPRDCLVTRQAERLDELPRGAVVGTSSLRRSAQRLAPTSRPARSAGTSTRASERSTRANTTPSCSPPPAFAGSGSRPPSRSGSLPRPCCPPRARALSRCSVAPTIPRCARSSPLSTSREHVPRRAPSGRSCRRSGEAVPRRSQRSPSRMRPLACVSRASSLRSMEVR